jgi:hypothetical protein
VDAVKYRSLYRSMWESEMRRRSEIERILDRVLGEDEESGSGQGFVADVALAVKKAWDQGYSAGVRLDPTNPYGGDA